MPSVIKNLVIADDDQDDVELFQIAVEDTCSNLNMTVATDGVKLLNLLKKIPKPDVIVLDLNMPFKSGKECLAEIRSKDDFNNVPIVILSTSSHRLDIEYCLRNGANKFLVKPNSFKGMKSIVTDICNGAVSC